MDSYDIEKFKSYTENIHPGLSVDCVIFSFHEQKMVILLNKLRLGHTWMLPGGLIHKDEDVDEAVERVLYKRTGLNKVKLRQFHLFGKKDRGDIKSSTEFLSNYGLDIDYMPNLTRRFATMGYFAFVRYDEVVTQQNEEDISQWFEISQIPQLSHDHNEIIEKAIQIIRLLIDIIPIGYELLPKEFTIVELRKIYESILGEELDKRNFRKKMLNSGMIVSLNK